MTQSNFKKNIQQVGKTPVGILGFGIIATIVIIGGYKLFLKPKLERSRYEEAEAYANFLFDKEKLSQSQYNEMK